VRRGCSVWARVGEQAKRRAVTALADDLDSVDLGARLLIAGTA
jgi:hypothetical protein